MSWQLSDFDYDLPSELIAQRPLPERTASRLCHVQVHAQTYTDRVFTDLLDLLSAGDLLILNNTKVLPARLYGRKSTGGQIECLFERVLSDQVFLAHVRSNRRLKPGAIILFGDGAVQVEMVGREGDLFQLKLLTDLPIETVLMRYGHCPLPPYITHVPDQTDAELYQTVFAAESGALAAPTAGLHFDEGFLSALKAKGVRTEMVTLHVGAGTFQPVRVTDIAQHEMHAEWIEVSQSVCDAVAATKARGHHVMAVGTTVFRALETAALSGELQPYTGDTRLFVTPGFECRVADKLLTNFHLPESTLLMLISAFGGYDLIRSAYQFAIEQRFRFFSYGDAMLIDCSS